MEDSAKLLRQIAEQLMTIADGMSGEESEEESSDLPMGEVDDLPKANPKAAILAILAKKSKE